MVASAVHMLRFALGLALCVAGVARAQEVDVRGSWQATLDCGAVADAGIVLQLDEDLNTGVVSSTSPAVCGTIIFPQVVPITSCTTTPLSVTGQVSGAAFSLPDAGTYTSDSMVEPFLLSSCEIGRVVVDQSLAGTITDDGAGIAVSIAGTLTTAGGAFYRTNGALCVPVTNLPDCAFEMRRNDVPAGTNVRVAPTSVVSLEFATVTNAGIATAFVGTLPTARVPAEFRVFGVPGTSFFWNLASTATFSGPVTACFTYPDANGDGIVDGAVPALNEAELQVIQDAGAAYADATSSRDPVGNVVCGTLTSLSQITFGAPYFGVRPLVDRPIAGTSLKLQQFFTRPYGSRLTFSSKDPTLLVPVAAGPEDPQDGTPGGALVEVFASGDRRGSFLLPASGWKRSPRGDRWKYLQKADRGAHKVALVAGKALNIQLQQSLLEVGMAPIGPIALRVQTGALRNCALFGEGSIKIDGDGRFVASKAPAPALPDCSDVTLVAATAGP